MRTTLHTRRAVAALAAVGALALAGCGGNGDGKGGPAGSTGPTGSAETVSLPRLDGQELQVVAVWTGPEQEAFTKVLQEFERRTGAKVGYVPTQDAMLNYIGTKIAGGAPPDVAMLQQVGALHEAVERGWAKPAGRDTRGQVEANYSRGWQQLGTVDSRLYGVYFKAANKSLVWYNAAVFDNAGVSEPKTWKEFLSTAETISASGVAPVSVGGADGWTLTDWFENVYLSQAGPEKYDRLARHEIPWTDPSVTKALTTLAELFGRPDLIAGGADGALQTEFPASVTQTFTGGDRPKAAMVFEGDFVSVNIAQTDAEIGTDAKVFPFPAVDGEPPVVTGGDVAVALTDKPAAQALMTFLASPDAAALWAAEGGFLSPNKALDPAAYPNDVQRGIAEALIASGDSFRFDMSDQMPQSFGGTPGKGEWKALQDFLKNPRDVAGTQRRLEADAAAAYRDGS
ncbi:MULTISPECIES: ABC transporter substrate-binding protein [unclassified Streptomyces]|uniref:ABC transporter substrate-binding protein n=1 Tax=unclassified Streptomyces TaxID=2593676 RepID=UPI0008DD1452|nr:MULTISPECIES: ABC transporter substrate-binding protein [unclassified Streptomyces]OII69053.1 sugar ABC transporter substrate-binding protein [Streptomyces sp. CC77]